MRVDSAGAFADIADGTIPVCNIPVCNSGEAVTWARR